MDSDTHCESGCIEPGFGPSYKIFRLSVVTEKKKGRCGGGSGGRSWW